MYTCIVLVDLSFAFNTIFDMVKMIRTLATYNVHVIFFYPMKMVPGVKLCDNSTCWAD
jgi:hypothetical protein